MPATRRRRTANRRDRRSLAQIRIEARLDPTEEVLILYPPHLTFGNLVYVDRGPYHDTRLVHAIPAGQTRIFPSPHGGPLNSGRWHVVSRTMSAEFVREQIAGYLYRWETPHHIRRSVDLVADPPTCLSVEGAYIIVGPCPAGMPLVAEPLNPPYIYSNWPQHLLCWRSLVRRFNRIMLRNERRRVRIQSIHDELWLSYEGSTSEDDDDAPAPPPPPPAPASSSSSDDDTDADLEPLSPVSTPPRILESEWSE